MDVRVFSEKDVKIVGTSDPLSIALLGNPSPMSEKLNKLLNG
jgi:hypothetical protein